MLVYTTQAEQTAAKTAPPVTSFTRRSMLGGQYTCIITSEQANQRQGLIYLYHHLIGINFF